MRAVIKVKNNLLEILKFLEYNGYKWASGHKPTDGINWDIKTITVSGKTLTCKTCLTYEPEAITLEQFKNKIDMKRDNILPGHKLVLENGNVFVVMEYKNTKIAFPEGSSYSVTSLEDLCEVDLTSKPKISCIMKVLNAHNIPIWERKFSRSNIKAGFTITSAKGVNYLIVNHDCNLRIMNTKHFAVGPCLYNIMNEDLTPVNSNYDTIVEVRDKEGKVVYRKE